jgi:hypothetical protein
MTRSTPNFLLLLSEADKEGYSDLQEQVLLLTERCRRGHRLEAILDCFRMIRSWAQRGDGDDWKRCCVCGLFHMRCGIAVNWHQLKCLMDRCKSSINGGLKKLDYGTISARGDMNPELVSLLPNLKGDTHELRQWSVRRPKSDYKPASPPPGCVPASPPPGCVPAVTRPGCVPAVTRPGCIPASPPGCVPAPQEASHDMFPRKIDDCDLSLACFLNPDRGSVLNNWDTEQQPEFQN